MTMVATLPQRTSKIIVIPSRLFGPIGAAADDLLMFPDGLLGFTGAHRLILLDAEPNGVYWLQSADEGNLAFLMVDPVQFFPDYAPLFPGPLRLGAGDRLFAIVTMAGRPDQPTTANLQAPVIINPGHRTGRQTITDPLDYGTKHPLTLPRASSR